MMDFDGHCQAVARRFIQSVMVVDDQADLSRPMTPSGPLEVIKPNLRSIQAREDEAVPAEAAPSTAEPTPAEVSHSLDGMRLTRSFAKLGVACSIYRPELIDGDQEIDDTVKVARHADVVVLDWRLGKDSNKAREIVKRILSQDATENGRLRLIAIYTGEVGLAKLRDSLGDQLAEAGFPLESSGARGPVALTKGPLRIVFINKAHAGAPLNEPGVGEGALPDKLVAEFAEMSRGIMPTVALGAITEVRNSTHHVLAKFHAGLDGALATHRALQPSPEDAEAYVANLVAEELRSVIEANEVGAKHAGIEVFKAWITYRAGQGLTFGTAPGATRVLAPAAAGAYLEVGSSQQLSLMPKLGLKKNELADGTSFVFHADQTAAAAANLEFSRMAVLKREAYGLSSLPEGWLPTLTLGSVVMRDGVTGGVFVCTQPVCDAVRVPKSRRFPLLPLNAPSGDPPSFSLVLKLRDSSQKTYDPDHHQYSLEQVIFSGDPVTKTVIAALESGRYLFRADDGTCFEWLADLRDSVALRLVQRSSGQAGRVGLDEYEWLRIKGGKEAKD